MIEKHKKFRDEMRELLILRNEPIALTMIEDTAMVPEGVIVPVRDMGKHIALCQAFGMVRRDRKKIYMDKTSEWCWAPLVGFGFVESTEGTEAFDTLSRLIGISDPEAAREFFKRFPRLPYGKYAGILLSPLGTLDVEPDLVMIYCNNAQLRHLVWAVKNTTGQLVSTVLDAIDSCCFSTVPILETGEYRVTLPDMGEHERAAADESEIILTVPGHRLEELMKGLHAIHDRNMGYARLTRDMPLEFPRPPFYNDMFKMWGLEQGEDWKRS